MNSVGPWSFQAAVSSSVTSCQTAKRSTISVRHPVALSRCRRGRKCAEMPLKADRNLWACRTDLNRFPRPFTLSGGLMRILGTVIQIP
jgi:hypothetical protein